MSIVKNIQEALEAQDLEQVYQYYSEFYENFSYPKDLEELIDLAEYSAYIGFLDEAKKAFLFLTELESDKSEWTIQLAECLFGLGENDQALSILFDIPQDDSNYVVVLSIQAQIYFQQGDYDVALVKLQEALHTHPEEKELWFNIASVYYEMGDFFQSLHCLHQLGSWHDFSDPEAVNQLFLLNYLATLDDESIRKSLHELDESLLSNDILIQLVDYFIATQDFELAYEYITMLLLRHSDDTQALFRLAIYYHYTNKVEESKQTLDQLMEMDSTNRSYYHLQQENYRALQQFMLLKDFCIQTMRLFDTDEYTLKHLLFAYEQLEAFDEIVAIASMEEIQPYVDSELEWLFAKAFEQEEDFTKARQYYELAFPALKENIGFLLEYMSFLYDEGETVKVKELLTLASHLDPLHNEIVEWYNRLDDVDEMR